MEDDDIPDTRVFVKGLPPHYTTEQLGAHFAGRYQITDSVVIPNRRIGFVGFRNYTLAKNAVKYFDKSYIRMSKISVEVAQPVDFHRELNADSEPEPQNVRNKQVEQSLGTTNIGSTKSTFSPYESLNTKTSSKRKRADEEDQTKERKEYMEAMQSKSTSTWANGQSISNPDDIRASKRDDVADQSTTTSGKSEKRVESRQDTNEQETLATETSEAQRKRRKREKREKEMADASSKTGAEAVIDDKEARKKRKAEKKAKKLKAKPTAEGGVEPLNDDASGVDDAETDLAQPEIPRSDNDWLRGKTSRLLDLLDPDEQTNKQGTTMQQYDTQTDSSDEGEEMNIETKPGHVVSDPTSATADNHSRAKSIAVSNGRLFIRNLPFSTTEADLESTFARYGTIVEVHVSKDFKSSSSKGMAFLQFAESDAAESALRSLDGRTYQGRLLHILPASDKKASQLDNFTLSKLPLRKQKAIKQRKEASSSSFNWNSLYMNPDAVLASVADRLGVSKSEVLDPTSADAAVKQAIAETNTIKDTKDYLQNNGVSINAFKNARRDDRTLLLKNFSFGTTSDEIRGLLEPFGTITKLFLPPTGTMAIAQFEDSHVSARALKHLAYRNLKGSVLFLEKAPEGIFEASKPAMQSQETPSAAAQDGLVTSSDDTSAQTSATVFVRNLNFTTTSPRLAEVFNPLSGYLTATVKTRTDPKRPGEILSMGFGFVEFKTKDQAAIAIKALNGYKLDGHELLVKPSTKLLDAAEETRKADKAKRSEKKTKIIIKNLPFEASKKDIRALFGTYGQLRTVRVPKKFDQSTRGFAFADFVTAKEAENAMEALANTHLLGRRLVLDFAAGDSIDPEEEIEALERKMGQQIEMVNLSKITGASRKRFNIEARDGDEQF